MPINEARRVSRRSNLTSQQKREAEAAIYGLQESQHLPDHQLTAEELQTMRTLLAQYEGQHQPIKEFDLNKPPVAPYRFQEFPKMMYHHARHSTAAAHDADEQAELEAKGYQAEPFPPETTDDAEPFEAPVKSKRKG